MGGKLDGAKSMHRDDLWQVVDELLYWPGQVDEDAIAYIAGSYRRGHEVVGDLDAIVASKNWREPWFIQEVLAGLGLDVDNPLTYLTKKGTPRKMVNFIARVEQDCGLVGYSWPNGVVGCQVDLYFCDIEHIGPMLMFLTGSMEYNVWHRGKAKWHGDGFKLTQYELKPVLEWADSKRKKPKELGDVIPCADEFEVCQAIGIDWIPALLRDADRRNSW